jgi:hypothetical protein
VKLWLLNLTFISELSGHKLHEDTGAKGVNFSFDVQRWYENSGLALAELQNDVTCSFRSKYDELNDELLDLLGEDVEYQFGKMFHTRSVSEFFCECVQVK